MIAALFTHAILSLQVRLGRNPTQAELVEFMGNEYLPQLVLGVAPVDSEGGELD